MSVTMVDPNRSEVNESTVLYDEHRWPYIVNDAGYRIWIGPDWLQHTAYYQRLRIRDLRAERCA